MKRSSIMPDGGVVRMAADPIEGPLKIGPAISLGARRYIRVTFRDQRYGIPAEVLPRIFYPYFSTKERGAQKGMGLGLSACHSIMKKHGGHITARSEVGMGTTICIYLPASGGNQSR